MPLSEHFPTDPYAILDPAIPWYPGDELLLTEARGKLIPPLVETDASTGQGVAATVTKSLTSVPTSVTSRQSRSSKGASGCDPDCGASAAPAGGARNPALGRLRDPARPALRPVREELAAKGLKTVRPVRIPGSAARG